MKSPAKLVALSLGVLIGSTSFTSALELQLRPAETAPFMHVDELRGGFMINDFVDNHPGEESGYNATGQILFGAPDFAISNEWINFALTPRPFATVSLNTHGDTSFVAAGFAWDLYITDKFFIEGGLGAAVHDGSLTPKPGSVGYGCRANFFEYGAVGFDFDENWRVLLNVDHFSNGNACKPNSGNSTIGMQIGYKF